MFPYWSTIPGKKADLLFICVLFNVAVSRVAIPFARFILRELGAIGRKLLASYAKTKKYVVILYVRVCM
jgi:hypothetical protein